MESTMAPTGDECGHDEASGGTGTKVALTKLVLMIIMIIATLFFGIMPVRVLKFLRSRAARASSSKSHKSVSLVLCLLTCFSGGVFLATCFLHLLPELTNQVNDMRKKHGWTLQYPLDGLLACAGFFLLFFLEELVIILIPSFAHHGHAHGGGPVETSPLAPNAEEAMGMASRGCCMSTVVANSSRDVAADGELKRNGTKELDVLVVEANAGGHCTTHCPLTVHERRLSGSGGPHKDKECVQNPDRHATVALAEPERCEKNCDDFDEDPPILMTSSPHAHSHGVRSITFVLALSLHSVIEGMAFGVQATMAELFTLWISLMVHKVIVAFSVGLQLARTHAHAIEWVLASMFILSIMTPLGALAGATVLGSGIDGAVKDTIVLVMQGLAVGTFLYVTFFEVLLHERDNEHPNLLKLLLMIVGFALIGSLRVLDDHEHGHGGRGHGCPDSSAIVNATLRHAMGVEDHDHADHDHHGHSH